MCGKCNWSKCFMTTMFCLPVLMEFVPSHGKKKNINLNEKSVEHMS